VDTLPSGATFVSASGDHSFSCSYASGKVTCTGGSIAAGESATITIKVKFGVSFCGDTVKNKAEVDPDDDINELNDDNNTTGDVQTKVYCVDLTISKVDSPDPVAGGANLTYTLTVGNSGIAAASDVKVVDTLPSGATFVSASGDHSFTCSYSSNKVTCTRGSIAAGTTATIAIKVKFGASSCGMTVTNTAKVDPDNGIDESNEDNNETDGVGTSVICGPAKFFVADDSDNMVYKYDALGIRVGTFSLASANTDPNGVAVVGGDVYVLDKADKIVYKYDSSGTLKAASKTLKESGGGSLSAPTGLAIDGTDLWLVDDSKGKIYRYVLSNAFSGSGNLNAAQEISFSGDNGSAEGLAIDATYVYVLDDGDRQVYRYKRDGTGSPFASKVMKEVGGGSLSSPSGATIDGTSFWIVDRGKVKAYEYGLSNLFAGTGNLNASSEFSLDPANDDARGL